MKKNNNSARVLGALKNTLRALRYKNYRLYFVGQAISLTGTWMQQVAMSWLVYRLTGSEFLLGVVSFSTTIPIFLLTPFTGVLADRYNRRNIIIATQITAMTQSLALAVLVLFGGVAVWHIIALGLLLGVANAFEMPARQSFIIVMVEDKADLSNAIALNSALFNGARLIGPSIAGVLISIIGEGGCFLINTVSFLAVIAALLAMNITGGIVETNGASAAERFREGFSYAFGHRPIRSILLLLALVSLMGMPFMVLMPVFASEILHGGAGTLGFLMSSAGMGAFAAALYLASRRSVMGLEKIISHSVFLFSASIIVFAASRAFWLSVCMLFCAGFSMVTAMASSNTYIQTVVDDDKRGRVMSFFTLSFMGMAPFGSLLAGALAHRIGSPMTIVISGIACAAGGVLFLKRRLELAAALCERASAVCPALEVDVEME